MYSLRHGLINFGKHTRRHTSIIYVLNSRQSWELGVWNATHLTILKCNAGNRPKFSWLMQMAWRQIGTNSSLVGAWCDLGHILRNIHMGLQPLFKRFQGSLLLTVDKLESWIPLLISNYIHYTVWYKFTYPFPNFMHRWSLGMTFDLTQSLCWVYVYLSMLGLKLLVHVNKMDTRSSATRWFLY